MTIKEAKDYLNYAVKEGYMDEDYVDILEKLPRKAFLDAVEKMMDMAEYEQEIRI